MTGTVVQVSVSNGGVPKVAIPAAHLTDTGIVGDAWRYPFHGGARQAILMMTAEGIDELVARGFPVFPGAMGENLTTRGLDRRALRVGDRLRVGEADLALTRIRTPCTTLDVYGPGIQAAIYDARVQAGDSTSDRWGASGFYAAVIRGGAVRPGDPIALVRWRARM
jgi:MOSC domain-containing protein YiiM